MASRRADILLVERGLVDSRTRAQALIMAGLVYQRERRIEKPGDLLAEDSPLELRGQDHPWVSRGGLKLAHALTFFELTSQNAVALDIGASTGGFTDVLLTHGAKKVYAVDVGHGQLAWKLRSHADVVVMEKTNARYLTEESFNDRIEVVVCDTSFIGLRTVLPPALNLCARNGWAVALIKPQFEARRQEIGSRGVVRDPHVHARICHEIAAWWRTLPGWQVVGIEPSPITGPEGNREFLIAARKNLEI